MILLCNYKQIKQQTSKDEIHYSIGIIEIWYCEQIRIDLYIHITTLSTSSYMLPRDL